MYHSALILQDSSFFTTFFSIFALMRNLLVSILLALSLLVNAQPDAPGNPYNMTRITMNEGLPSNSITDIFEDSHGFMWIASDVGGLVRYDGFSFLPLRLASLHTPLSSPISPLSSSCRNVCEDPFGRLWIAYEEGISVLQLSTMSMLQLGGKDYADQLAALTHKPAMRVFVDSNGGVWIITVNEVCRITFDKDGQVNSLLTLPYREKAFDIAINDINGDGKPWVAIDGSIYQIVDHGHKLVREEVSPALTQQIDGYFVTCLLRHGSHVWIGTNDGLVCYDMISHTAARYRHDGSADGLSHNFVTSLLVNDHQQLLVGTLNGIDLYNDNGTFSHWNTYSSVNPLSSNFIHSLLTTHGTLWVGTDNAGLMKLTPRFLNLQNYAHTASAESLAHGIVNAMHADKDGTLWVGIVEGGLNRKAAGSNAFSHYNTANTRLTHNTVSAIEPGPDDLLWIGTWGGGVCVADKHHPEGARPISVQPAYQLSIAFVGALKYDQLNNGLWVATNGGIYFYDMATQELEEPFEGCRDIRGCIGSIIDSDSQLWIGCLDGVRVIDLKKPVKKGESKRVFKVQSLRHKLDQPESGITEKITCFCQASDGTLWLGSNGYGLYRRMKGKDGKDRFENFTTDDGLANNAVRGITEDANGQLIIATTNGLSMMDTKTRKFMNFTADDGLLSSQFYWNSVEKGPEGKIYLGSVDGVTVLEGLNSNIAYPGKLTFTRLWVANQEISAGSRYLDEDISQARLIRLHEADKSFAVAFSTLNTQLSTLNTELYSYRLRGFDNRWTQLAPGQHEVRYTNLPSGHYTLEVKCVSALQDDQTISIDIHVKPYFWKSWWFLFIVTMAAIVAAVFAYNRRVAFLRRREADRLLAPIEQVLRESDNPQQLQTRIETILRNQRRYNESSAKSVEADAMEQERNNVTFMERVMSVIEQNYMNSEFGVTEFCEQMGMSRSLLTKRLNEETGQSSTQFIRNYRLNVARQILKKADRRNIAEVAFSVGFNDPKYFTRCFTKQYGISPKYYDEQNNRQQDEELMTEQ